MSTCMVLTDQGSGIRTANKWLLGRWTVVPLTTGPTGPLDLPPGEFPCYGTRVMCYSCNLINSWVLSRQFVIIWRMKQVIPCFFIPIQIWRCGGRLEQVPCSAVAHLFRLSMPYKDTSKSRVRNRIRLAKVWLDDYAQYYLERLKTVRFCFWTDSFLLYYNVFQNVTRLRSAVTSSRGRGVLIENRDTSTSDTRTNICPLVQKS